MNTKICMYKVINKKTKVKLVLLTNFDVLLMVEKANRGGICYAIHRYSGTKKKYIKSYGKNKESLYLKY